MNFLKKMAYYFSDVERYLVVILYSYFTLIVIIEVFRRYGLNSASQWGEESARYAFIYMTYIGAAEAIKWRSHLKIDFLQERMNKSQLFASYLLTDICFMVLAVLVIRFSINVVHVQWTTETMMQGMDWNLAWATAALPIGWSLIMLRLVQRFSRTIREFRSGQLTFCRGGGMGDES